MYSGDAYVGPSTSFPMAGEAGRDRELTSSYSRQASPTRSAFNHTLDPDLVADRRVALLPAELAATAMAITPIQACAQRRCMLGLISVIELEL